MDEQAKDEAVHQEGGRAYDREPDRVLAEEAHAAPGGLWRGTIK